MSVTVTSHVTLFLRCHGMRVSSSGRFSSVRDSPGGSRTDGVLALVSARYIMSWFVMSYGSAGAPFVREAVRTSCVILFAARTLMRFAEAGAETKTHSNSDYLIVEPQPARMLTAGDGANHRYGVPMLPRAELC